MKNLLAATVFALLPFGAVAADLPARNVAPAFVAAHSWSGLYVGLNGGAIYSTHDVNDFDYWNSGATSSYSKVGALAGGAVGYNIQIDKLVLGVEGDLSYVANNVNSSSIPDSRRIVNEMNWLGTVRARMGVSVDRALIYMTGGVAFAGVKNSYTDSLGDEEELEETWRKGGTRTGFVAGAGVEYALNNNWTLKGEALYLGFPQKAATAPAVCCGGKTGFQYGFGSSHVISRIGVNYRY